VTAYDILGDWKTEEHISEHQFNTLIKDFQQKILDSYHYDERIGLHRNPIELRSEILQKLYEDHQKLQHRPEMHDDDKENKTFSYVPSAIQELWRRDKRLKSLYNVIHKYSATRNKDFNTIAIHIAEFRAINKLISRIRKDINSQRKAAENNKGIAYTFEDWLNNKFYNERTYGGAYVANDSEKYLELVSQGKMTYDEVNKIQDAQQKAYDYMIESTVTLNERFFRRHTTKTPDLERKLALEIEAIGKYFSVNQVYYNEVLLPRMHRGIKIGAKYLLPEHYTNSLKNEISDANMPGFSVYSLNIEGELIQFPTKDQMKYIEMEVQIRWLKILQGYKDKMKFDEMITSKDFKELIDNYGAGEKLMDEYVQGLNFAPDRDLFISNRIKTYESVLPQYKASIATRDRQNKKEIIVQVGDYRRIGYAWVNNGYNGTQMDLQGSTLRNITLCPDVPPENRYAVYNNVLYELATGGAIAFHLAFLRAQLKKQPGLKNKKVNKTDIWLDTETRRVKLFEGLAENSFIENSVANKEKFLKNQQVQWKQDGRSLFYLLDQLRQKKYGMLDRFANLGPIIRENFTSKDGEAFKNVSQNMSGMNNANKNGRPRLAPQIDEILGKVFGA